MTGNEKFEARAKAADSLLCVSLDPEFERLPGRFLNDPHPQFAFSRSILDETADMLAAVKINPAFYEARGATGIEELEMTSAYVREHYPDIFLICDAKRGEVVNSMKEYAKAIFDHMGFDACTVSPYFGGDALAPFLERKDKTTIIICRTSNPGAREIQDLRIGERPVWQAVAERVRDQWNDAGNCMLVAAGTYPGELATLRRLMGEMTFLVPGFGAQGAPLEAAVPAGRNSKGLGMILVAARSVIFAEDPGLAAKTLKEEINKYR